MEQVINRIKNSIMDSVGYFDHYLNAKKQSVKTSQKKKPANQFIIGDKSVKYDADLAFDMMTQQHKMLKVFMEMKHTVRAFNKSKSLRLLEKFCPQFTENMQSKNEVFYPLLQFAYADNKDTLNKIQELRSNYELTQAAVKQFCDDCKTVSKIGPSNVDALLQLLENAISLFIEYSNDEEHYLHALYNRIPTHIAESDKKATSVDMMIAG